MSITPSPDQVRAIEAVATAFANPNQQIIRLAGAAGTGKSALAKHGIVPRLGLNPIDPREASYDKDGWSGLPERPRVVVGAPTGKAALVQTNRGLPAATLHSLQYRCVTGDPDEIATADTERETLLTKAKTHGLSFDEQRRAHELGARLAELRRPRWTDHPHSLIKCADLLIVDEASMVNTATARDLAAHGRKILLIGDPYQLAPVEGQSIFQVAPPDALLTEVHRQNGDGGGAAILDLAHKARAGEPIIEGAYGDGWVSKRPRATMPIGDLLAHDQIIVGTNQTRRTINTAARQHLGFHGVYPTGNGERLICLKNYHEHGLINGMFVALHDVADPGPSERFFEARVVRDDGRDLGIMPIWKSWFDDPNMGTAKYTPRDWKAGRAAIHLDWAWAITCHKAQGSEWETVAVIDESFCFRADRHKWAYTAITRAKQGLTIYG